MTNSDTAAGSRSWWVATALVVLRHPQLWVTAVSQGLRLASPGWWRRRPFMPLPDPNYMRFRMETQYGDQEPSPQDVVTYLRWVRQANRTA